MSQQTAILFFTLTPQEEARKKSFLSTQKEHDLKVAHRLIAHTKREALKTGLPLYTAYGIHQQGNNFGERLAYEVEKVFKAGYEKVIIIGNDTPQISSGLLLQASKKLLSSDWVLGPSADGGFYLIGLHKHNFNKEKFIQQAWESENLQATFSKYLSEVSEKTVFLPTFTDYDHFSELQNIIAELSASHEISKYLNNLIHVPKSFNSPNRKRIHTQYLATSAQLRAPPIYIP